MDDSLKWVIIGKANKIYNSKREPQSDEKFLRRKEQIDKQYAEAKKNYFLTLEERYKIDMKRIKRRHLYNVSKTEYELCKSDLKILKEKYNSEADNDFWIYIESLYNFKI